MTHHDCHVRPLRAPPHWSGKPCDERAGGVYGVKGSFLFTSLHSHPRFTALLKRMNLE